eukprot:gene3183-13194_t
MSHPTDTLSVPFMKRCVGILDTHGSHGGRTLVPHLV